jgi:hypothetical protein
MQKNVTTFGFINNREKAMKLSLLVVPLLFAGLSPAAAMALSTQGGQSNSVASADLSTLSSGSANDALKTATLRYRINQIIQQNESQGITTDVSIDNLQTNQALLEHNQETAQFAASVNKLPVAWLVLQDLRAGKLHLGDMVSWTASDVRAGYGLYDQPGAPLQASVQDVIFDMFNRSGNTAVRVLVNYELGGAAAVNNRLAQYPQIPNTRLQPLDSTHFYLGNSTSRESLWIMEQLQKAKDMYEKFMQHAMVTNIFVSFGVRSQLAGNSYIQLANKVGILDDPTGNNRHDVGIIYNSRTHKSFGYSFMTTNFTSDGVATMQAEASLQQMGRDLLRYAGDKPQSAATPQMQTLNLQAQAQHVRPDRKIRY